MFSKLMTGLVLTMSLMLASNAFAQTGTTKKPKADPKKTATAKDTKAAEEARLAAQKKAEEEKALEAKRAEEAKLAAEKAKESEANSGFFGYVKSHFSASYHGEYYGTRRDIESADKEERKIKDLKIMHNPTIIYRPIKNWKLLATSEFKYSDVPNEPSFINRHYRSLVLLTRENLLTEKEDGVKLDMTIGRRIMDRNHGKAGSYGNSRINVNVSKKFANDKLATSLLTQYLANDPAKGKITKKTWKHDINFIPTFTWQITDKLSWFFNDDFNIYTSWHNDNYRDTFLFHEMNIAVLSYQFTDKQSAYFQYKYLREPTNFFQLEDEASDHFDYYIGYTYSITPKINITPEIGSVMFQSKDGRFFAKNMKYPEVALYLDITL